MASEQVRREKRDTQVEKDVVPKLKTHYESLSEKAKSPQGSPDSVGETKIGEGKKWGRETREGEGRRGPSLEEEISQLRGTAQQNSMDTIMAAEERYQKAKGSAGQGIQTGSRYISDKSGALKENAVEKDQQAKDYTTRKAVEAKDSLTYRGGALKDTAVERGQQAKGYTAKKTVEAKDVVASAGQCVTAYVSDKAMAAKDTTVDTTKNVASYVGERAANAKDATVKSGKSAAGYAGKVATGAKDQAVAAGWGVTSSVAEYTGETAVATKDKVAGAGQTAVGYAGRKLAAAKDAVVAGGEKAAEYADRKKTEAQRNLEAKKASDEKGEKGVTFETREERGAPTVKFFHKGAEDEEMPRPGNGGGGSVFQAIGETLMEIGQVTKDLLVGQYPIQFLEHKDREFKDKEEE